MLKRNFYLSRNPVKIAQNLLGKIIITSINDKETGGIIKETEAYKGGYKDKASHAYKNKKTTRNEAMYEEGGCIYIYKCYGIHNMLNIVTGPKNFPSAILIRSIQPTIGIQEMLHRRKKTKTDTMLIKGPGNVCQSLGLDLSNNKDPLFGPKIKIIHQPNVAHFYTGTRIGIDYAKEDALLPWRFWIS